MTDFTFLYLADSQLGCYATFSGMNDADIADFAERNMQVRIAPKVEGWEWDAARYRDAVSIANEVAPDFVIIGGDMVNDLDELGQLEAFDAITEQLDESIPLHFVPGNHDISYDAKAPSTKSVETYRGIFGPDYYAFEHKGAAVVVIDSVVFDEPAAIPDLYEEQLSWLDRALDDTDALPGQTIVISHHPLFLDTPEEPEEYWNLPPAQRQVLFDVFSGHDISTVFHGHLHRNVNATHGGIEYVTSSAVGYPLGKDPSGYRLVHVSDDTISHTYHGFEEQGWGQQ